MTAAAEIPSTFDTGSVRPKVLVEFRKHSGSTLGGFFGAAAFDEVALVPVAAAVDKTGRFAANFADRGVRSGFSTFLAIWGDSADRAAEGERLKRLHKDVRGNGIGDFAERAGGESKLRGKKAIMLVLTVVGTLGAAWLRRRRK